MADWESKWFYLPENKLWYFVEHRPDPAVGYGGNGTWHTLYNSDGESIDDRQPNGASRELWDRAVLRYGYQALRPPFLSHPWVFVEEAGR
jgi:hypothetical protein